VTRGRCAHVVRFECCWEHVHHANDVYIVNDFNCY
jgi:hypothetical protein